VTVLPLGLLQVNFPTYEGTLAKKGEDTMFAEGMFKHRVFSMHQNVLSWKDESHGKEQGKLQLDDVTLECDGPILFLKSESKDRIYQLRAGSVGEAAHWYMKLMESIHAPEKGWISRVDWGPIALKVPHGPMKWLENQSHWTSAESSTLGGYLYQSSALSGHECTNLVDGVEGSDWEATGAEGQWVIFDLGKPHMITGFKYVSPSGPSCPRECALFHTDDEVCIHLFGRRSFTP